MIMFKDYQTKENRLRSLKKGLVSRSVYFRLGRLALVKVAA